MTNCDKIDIQQLMIDRCDLCQDPSVKVAEIEFQNGFDPYPVMKFINVCAKCAMEIAYKLKMDESK